MSTHYEVKGNEIYRNEKLVGKVIDEKLVMEDGMDKFTIPASKLVKNIVKEMNKEEEVKEDVAPFAPAEEAKEEVAVVPTTEEPPEEDVVKSPTDKELIAQLMKDNKELAKQVKALHDGVNLPVDPSLISPAIVPIRKNEHNPFGWEARENVPPCPDGGEEGTKNDAVIAWAEKYYPEEAEEKYANFFARKRFLEARAEQKRRKKDYAQYK